MSRTAFVLFLGFAFWLLNISATTDIRESLPFRTDDLSLSTAVSEQTTQEDNFSCVGEVIVTLDDNCEAELDAQMVLNGDGVENLRDYNVVVLYDDGSRTVNKVITCGTFKYEVYDNNGNFVCWGSIVAEDKTAPVIRSAFKADTLTCTDVDSIFNVGLYDFDNLVWKRLKDKGIFSIKDSIIDNCSNFDHLSFLIQDIFEPTTDPCEETGKIFRRIQVTDEKGNVSRVDSIVFVFIQPELVLDEIKEGKEVNACADEGYELSREEAGAPFYLNGFGDKVYIYNEDITLCNYAIAFKDDTIPENCGFKLIRDWLITDWCGNRIDEHQQVIKVGDFEAPEVFCPAGIFDNRFSTNFQDCSADIDIPRPIVRDNCDNIDFSYSVEVWTRIPEVDIFGIPTGDTVIVKRNNSITGDDKDGYEVSNIPIGEHFFYYYVVDKCGNAAEVVTCPFTVFDGTPPAPVCVDLVNISLGGEGIGTVGIAEINEGSTDNCQIEKLELRRQIKEDCLDAYVDAILSGSQGRFIFSDLVKDADADIWRFEGDIIITKQGIDFFSAYSNEVVVSCCDVGSFVNIELRVTDKSGNTNSCWTIAQVEDKLNPICLPPQNVIVDCDTITLDRNNFGDTLQLQRYYGFAIADDNCSAIIRELEPNVNVGACDIGTITRKFEAVDPFGNVSANVCEQTITIQGVFEYEIRLPADESAVACGFTPADTIVDPLDLGCGIFAIEVDVERLVSSGEECYKEFRTYSMINWCEYDGTSLEPTIIGRDEDNDGIPGEEIFLIRRRDGTYYIDDNNDETDGFLRSGTNSNGWYQYAQIIKVNDNTAPTIEWPSENEFCSFDSPLNPDDICEGYVEFSFMVDDECTPNDLETRLFFDEFADGEDLIEITMASGQLMIDGQILTFAGNYSIGQHSVQVRVIDGCGNFTVRRFNFEIVDCKAPSPICIQGNTVTLMPLDMDGNGVPDFGMGTIPAISLIGSEVFDCSGEVTYSINRKGGTPDRSQTDLMVNCTDPLGETVPVEVWAWDALGNHNFCETFIIIQDSGNFCEGGIENGIVAGHIYTEDNQPVEGAQVRLSGEKNSVVSTNIDGAFEFVDLEEGKDYTVTPESFSDDYINGVSTFDLVLISRHILGVDVFDNPYQILAADVNRSNGVTTIDLIHMRKLILSVTDTFPNNSSWRFIRADYEFPDPLRPWEGNLEEFSNINNLLGTASNVDFIAVKVGDINGSVQLISSSFDTEERSASNPLVLEINDQILEPGQAYTLDIKAKNLADFVGSQFGLSFDPDLLSLENIDYNIFREANLGLNSLADGLITSSWNSFEKQQDDAILFSLTFSPKVKTRWSEVIALSSRLLRSEAYTTNEAFKNIDLTFSNNTVEQPMFELFQNTPNPFNNQTLVKFNLPEASDVIITIYDANGQIVTKFNNFYDAGSNELIIKGEDLKNGVLYYHLQTNNYQATKKMVFID